MQIHDHHRAQVGGIPALSFLMATRINPPAIDIREEDASRPPPACLDHADLPNAAEALRVRVETAQRVSGEVDRTWDDRDVMDATTHHLLSYAGIRCRVLGTFYVERLGEDREPPYRLSFGSDISNYYPNRGLKVFKPRGELLAAIVNYRDPRATSRIGHLPWWSATVRYASTNRPFQQVAHVSGIELHRRDLLGQKSALFGMTRNRQVEHHQDDPQVHLRDAVASTTAGASARSFSTPMANTPNENTQDANHHISDGHQERLGFRAEACIKALKADVVTYGITPHANDPRRQPNEAQLLRRRPTCRSAKA